MRTLRLPSPFDDPRRGAAVATPTCCSCCCCLVTTLTSTTMAAVYVNQRARSTDVGLLARIGLSVAGVAGLLLATAGLLGAAIGLGGPTTEVLLGGLAAFMSGLVLLVIARSGGGGARFGDLGWAASVAALTTVTFVLEVVTFGIFLWGQLLAVPVPIIAGILLHRRMGRRL